MENRLSRFEIWALASAMFAQAVNITRWYIGDQAPSPLVYEILAWISVIASVAAGIAFDAVAVVTVIGRRDGRRSKWGWATAGVASLFSAAIALELYGGPSAGPWLHVGYPVLIFLFIQHLATPRQVDQNELEQARAETEQAVTWLEQSKADAKHWQHAAEQERQRAEQLDLDYKRALDYGLEFEGRAKQAERAAAQTANKVRELEESIRDQAEHEATKGTINLIRIAAILNSHEHSQREIAALLNTSATTVNGWLKKTEAIEQAASNGKHEEVVA